MKKIFITLLFFTFLCPLLANAQSFSDDVNLINKAIEGIKTQYTQEELDEAGKAQTAGGRFLDKITGGYSKTVRTNKNTKQTVTFTDSSGRNWEIEISGGSGSAEVTSGAMKGCAPLAMKIADFADCFMCPRFRTIFNTANELIKNAFENLANPLRKIMSLVFALVIAIKVFMQVSSFTAEKTEKFLEDLLKQTFKFTIAFLFLTYYRQVFYWVFNPILKAGIEMGASFLITRDDINNIEPTLAAFDGFFGSDIYAMVDRFTQAIQLQLAFTQAIGSSLMCTAFNDAAYANILPDIGLLISGVTMYVLSLLISLGFGFYLIDAILQLCIVGVLTPFSLAAFPFKFSQKWMITTWKFFLDSFFKFVFMGIVISIVTTILEFSITRGLGGTDIIVEALNLNSSETIAEFFDITSLQYITFFITGYFAIFMTQKAADLSASISDGSVVSEGSKIGTLIASAGTNTIKKATKSFKGSKRK